jgi:hypothetical protein
MFAAFQWWELNTQNINQSAANIEATAAATETEREVRTNAADTHALAVQAGTQATAALKQSAATELIAKASQAQAAASLATANAAKASCRVQH